jgi:predicted peroxiredoxin
MAKFLVHIHTGPENPTKAALGCLVALTALKEGHDVDLVLAGDAVHLFASDLCLRGAGLLGGAGHRAACRSPPGHR